MRRNITGIILGILLSIPIIVCKIKVAAESNEEYGVRPFVYETTEEVTTTEHMTEVEVETTTEVETETETEVETIDRTYEFINLSNELQIHIYELCEEYEIAYELCLAIIKTESNFNVDAIGDNGQAIGLCQIWPRWWQGVADSYNLNIYEPTDNVELMLIILTSHLDAYEGDLTKALQTYNTGEPYGDTYANRIYVNYEWILNEV